MQHKGQHQTSLRGEMKSWKFSVCHVELHIYFVSMKLLRLGDHGAIWILQEMLLKIVPVHSMP